MGFISAIVGAAQGTAGSVLSYMEGKAQYEGDKEQQELYNTEVRKETIESLKDVTQAKADVLYNIGQDTLQSQLDTLEARSSTQVLGNAMGLRGGGYASVMLDLEREGAQSIEDIRKGREASISKIRRQGESIRRGEAARLDTRVLRPPSVLKATMGAVLGGLKGGAQGYAQGKALEKAYSGSQTTTGT